MEKEIILKLIKKGDASPSFLARLKKKTAKKYHTQIAPHAQLLKVYHNLIKNKTIVKNRSLENLLRKRAVRTLSGIAVVTVLTKPYPCPGQCIFCPKEPGMPKSYLKSEPAANRAWMAEFDPYEQVRVRLKSLADNGHPIDKIELIVLGGTWSAYPENYQYWFIKDCFRAANDQKLTINNKQLTIDKKDVILTPQWRGEDLSRMRDKLKTEQRKSATAKHRIIGLTLETRPDYINLDEIKRMRDLGATRVELGVQNVYDDILKRNCRGHTVTQTIAATKLLKNAGFKINYHMMLNLPGTTPRRDRQMFKELFFNPDFQPDLLKIYPCAVLKTASLYNLWRAGQYRPYTEKQLVNLLLKIKQTIPPYVRIQRIIRDIPAGDIIAGSKTSNLRQLINNSGKKQCRCIRCREIKGSYLPGDKIKLFRQDYLASGGQEIFLSFESPDRQKLYALLRLRIPAQTRSVIPAKAEIQIPKPESRLKAGMTKEIDKNILPVLENAALIRELHTYGQLVPLKAMSSKLKVISPAAQHIGLGKQLMLEAEKIVRTEFALPRLRVQNHSYGRNSSILRSSATAEDGHEFPLFACKKIAVISGVGAREYYKKLGYKLEDEYMVKNI